MELSEALAVTLGVFLAATMSAVGWLVLAVIRHGKELSEIRAEVAGQSSSDGEIKELVRESGRESGRKLDALHGDNQRLLERTDWLMRTADRHERFLDSGRLDREGA